MFETEKEYIDKAEEERVGIFEKYDRGPEGNDVPDWENPKYEIYDNTDQYGFIHPGQQLPNPSSVDQKKRINLEMERVEKWRKMTNDWGKYANSEKLKKRTYKGIPDRMRAVVWGLFLELEGLRKQQPGVYLEMLKEAKKYSPDIRQIDLDVNRTYRDHIFFMDRYGQRQKALFNVLSAYSVYNSEVGYCQGMSNLAALLLIFFIDEEDAFWGLAQLMTHPRYRMHGFFIAGFPKLVRFQRHHDKVLEVMFPKLKKHFDRNGVDSGLYTLKWFFQCFLDRIPYELALRLWDIYMFEGEKVLICGAYTILKIHGKQLLARKNIDDILTYMQSNIPKNFDCDSDKAIEFYQKYSEDLHKKKLDTAGEPGDDELVKRPFGLIDHLKIAPSPKPPSKVPVVKKSPPPVVVETPPVTSVPELSPVASSSPSAELQENERSSTLSQTPSPLPVRNAQELNSEIERVERELENIRTSLETPSPAKDSASPGRAGSASPSFNTLEVYHAMSSSVSPTKRSLPNNVRTSPTPYVQYGTTAVSLQSSSPRESRMNFRSPSPGSGELRDQDNYIAYAKVTEDYRMSSKTMSYESTQNDISWNYKSVDSYDRNRPRSISPPSSNIIPNDSIVRNSSPASSVHIPGGSGEAVRIHVPYKSASQSSHSSTRYSPTPPVSPRNGIDISKSDPNRIKIDVSAGPGSKILG